MPPKPAICEKLKSLFCDLEFRKNVRKYNQALAWTSTGAKVDTNLANLNGGHYTFKIQGQLYHQIGSLLPAEGNEHKFAQIYFLDAEEQTARRNQIYDLNPEIFKTLSTILENSNNPYVQIFKQANEIISKFT